MKTITLLTKPIPLNQKFFIVNGRNILSKKYRDAKEAMSWEIRSEWEGEPLDGDVTLNIMFYYGDKRKRDIDAYLKILLDALEGIVFVNDNQVNELHVFKESGCEEHKIIVQVL